MKQARIEQREGGFAVIAEIVEDGEVEVAGELPPVVDSWTAVVRAVLFAGYENCEIVPNGTQAAAWAAGELDAIRAMFGKDPDDGEKVEPGDEGMTAASAMASFRARFGGPGYLKALAAFASECRKSREDAERLALALKDETENGGPMGDLADAIFVRIEEARKSFA